jgi:xanthine dehydrogenase accessory factor
MLTPRLARRQFLPGTSLWQTGCMTCAAEIAAIVRLARTCEAEGVRTALARLVSVEGSHYRKPGARMLLAEDGRSAGAISAGCLEADLRGRMPGVLASGQTEAIDYDSRTFEDLVWGLGTGCNGLVRVLLSPFSGDLRQVHERLLEILSRGSTGILETVLEPFPGSVLGQTRLLGEEGMPRDHPSRVFLEEVLPAVSLLIAGDGPDAVPLARLASGLGWSVKVLSGRDRAFIQEKFAGLPVEQAGGREFVRTVPIHTRTAAVVMSHSFSDDAAMLSELLLREPPYLGVLGPRERTERLLRACGAPPEARAKIHTPAGLDIGAETAEEIALSIVSEIQAALGGPQAPPRK